MWLFDKRAFTSTVAYDPKQDDQDTEHKKVALASENPQGWLLVRARVEADLDAVQEQLREITGNPDLSIYITEDKIADYSFRALLSRDDWKAYLCAQVDRIDYSSHFKEVVEANATQGKERHSAMMSVWSAMLRLQPYTPPTGSYAYTPGAWYGTQTTAGTTWRKPVAKYVPSTEFTTFAAMRAELTKTPVREISNEIINGATDDAFELWLAAEEQYGDEGPLTDEQVTNLITQKFPLTASWRLDEGDVVQDILAEPSLENRSENG